MSSQKGTTMEKKMIKCVKDCIAVGSLTSLQKMKERMENNEVSEVLKAGYQAIIDKMSIEDALRLEENNIFAGEEVELCWHGWSNEIDPNEPPALNRYVLHVQTKNGVCLEVSPDYFDFQAPRKPYFCSN